MIEFLKKHMELIGTFILSNHSSAEVQKIYEIFQKFAQEYPPSQECEKVIQTWRSSIGEDPNFGETEKTKDNTTLRRALRRLDAGKQLPPNKFKSSEELTKYYLGVRSTLHACGKDMTLPLSFLFRGLGMKSDQFTQEEFTATSMSCSRAFEYGKQELMIIHVPQYIVHGIVIYHTKLGMGSNEDSEILLLKPRLRECSDEENRELKAHFLYHLTDKSFLRKGDGFKITFWTYEGCAKWEHRVQLVNETLAFVKDNDNNLFHCVRKNTALECTREADHTLEDSHKCMQNPDYKSECLRTVEHDKRYETRTIIEDPEEREWFDYTYDFTE